MPRRFSRVRIRGGAATLIALLLAGLVVGTAPKSVAHTSLRSADPAPGARVGRPPMQVQLRLMKPSKPDSRTRIRVVGPSGVDLAKGPATVTGLGVSQKVAPAHEVGVYVVSYVVVSIDKHVTRGGYDFLLTGAAPAAPSHIPVGQLVLVGGVFLILVLVVTVGVQSRQRRASTADPSAPPRVDDRPE